MSVSLWPGERKQVSSTVRGDDNQRITAELRQFVRFTTYTTATSQSIHEQQMVDNGNITTQRADTFRTRELLLICGNNSIAPDSARPTRT